MSTPNRAEAGSWNEALGSTGRRADEIVPEDEDPQDEGRSEGARLVERGVEGAAEDQLRLGQRHDRQAEQ